MARMTEPKIYCVIIPQTPNSLTPAPYTLTFKVPSNMAACAWIGAGPAVAGVFAQPSARMGHTGASHAQWRSPHDQAESMGGEPSYWCRKATRLNNPIWEDIRWILCMKMTAFSSSTNR